MNQVRVEVDLNSVRTDGTTRVRLARASGELHQGQMVTAYESEDGIAGEAYVLRVDATTGYAFLTINRASLRDDDGSVGTINFSQNANRAVARVANQHATSASTGATVRRSALRRTY
ncbi:hypothetical protein [Curtobacterium aetherium]|uniref:Uncharacterized protein n=1 Tax=Curtobacterium aetherium TaxID=2841594 RepID=A0ACD1E560_9MICO|nr:hypothetical protein [Curtobacterium sp. L6-1]QWS34048.1 hypothetical protein KM842_02260 [Curtobacterium sp. L6-1]